MEYTTKGIFARNLQIFLIAMLTVLLMTLLHAGSFLFKHLLGDKPTVDDMAEVDPVYVRSLRWMLDNNIANVLEDETFSVTVDVFGATKHVELVAGGKEIKVNEANKRAYVEAVVDYKLGGSFATQLDALLSGFYHVIPLEELVSISFVWASAGSALLRASLISKLF